EQENAWRDGIAGAQPEIRHGIDVRAREIGAGVEVPGAADIGAEEIALDADHDGAPLPAPAADDAAETAVRVDRPVLRRDVVAYRRAADRAAEIPALEHVLRRNWLDVGRSERRRWEIGTKDWA